MKITGTFEYDTAKKGLVFRSADGKHLPPFSIGILQQEAVAHGHDNKPLPTLDNITLWFYQENDGSDSILLITTKES